MDGIIGKLSFDPRETLARATVVQMLDALAAGSGGSRRLYSAPGIALGTCGHNGNPQPAGSDVEPLATIRAVIDGHLTNATQLRRELRTDGFPCADDSDETLVARAFEAWDVGCIERFDGPFACAIWDEGRRRLMLARDHAGVRPLYYAVLHGHGVVFASAVAALLQDPGVTREWCPVGLDAYLALGYVPAPLTTFRRISKVEPAQYVVIEGRRLRAEKYWSPIPAQPAFSLGDAADELESHLRAHTREDSSAPILFSGGYGSAALLAASRSDARVSLTIAWDQSAADVASAHAVSMHLGHAARVEVQPAHAITLVSAVAAMLEEPIADPASVTQYAVCAVASLHGRTAFAGHGASALPATATAHALWDSRQRRQLYTRTFTEDIRGTQLAGGPSSTVTPFRSDYLDDEPGDTSAYVRTRTAWSRIPDSTLPLAQRAALATGLELRFPFASRSILELTARLNTESGRLADGFPSLLHRLVQRRVPSTLMPDARLSIVPDWLRGILAALVPSVLLAHRFDARGIVSRVALQSLWNEHCRGREDHSLRLWALLVLELWLRQSVDSEASAEPEPMSLLRVA